MTKRDFFKFIFGGLVYGKIKPKVEKPTLEIRTVRSIYVDDKYVFVERMDLPKDYLKELAKHFPNHKIVCGGFVYE